MDGRRLLQILIEATGLPAASLERELHQILCRGLDPDDVTLEDVREVLAAYLQDTLLEIKHSSQPGRRSN